MSLCFLEWIFIAAIVAAPWAYKEFERRERQRRIATGVAVVACIGVVVVCLGAALLQASASVPARPPRRPDGARRARPGGDVPFGIPAIDVPPCAAQQSAASPDREEPEDAVCCNE